MIDINENLTDDELAAWDSLNAEGFTKILNPMLEYLYSTSDTPPHLRVFFYVMRHTVGFSGMKDYAKLYVDCRHELIQSKTGMSANQSTIGRRNALVMKIVFPPTRKKSKNMFRLNPEAMTYKDKPKKDFPPTRKNAMGKFDFPPTRKKSFPPTRKKSFPPTRKIAPILIKETSIQNSIQTETDHTPSIENEKKQESNDRKLVAKHGVENASEILVQTTKKYKKMGFDRTRKEMQKHHDAIEDQKENSK